MCLLVGPVLRGQWSASAERVAWVDDSLAVLVGTAALDDDMVVMTGYPGFNDRQRSRILAVSPDGTVLWERDAGREITPPLVDREGRVVFAAGGHLFLLDPNGSEVSRIGYVGEVMGNLAQGPGNTILGLAGQSRESPDRLYRFDPSAGTANPLSMPGFFNGGIPGLSVTADALALAYSTRSTRGIPNLTGPALWIRLGATPTPLPDHRVLLTTATELHVVNRFGEIVSRITPPGLAPGSPTPVRAAFSHHALVTADGTIVSADRTNLVRWRPEQGVESFGTLPVQSEDPQSLALDSAGRVLVHRNESVWVIAPDGGTVEELTGLGVLTTPDILSPPGLPLLLTRGGLLVIPRRSPRGVVAIRMPHGLDSGAHWASARGDARCSASAPSEAPPLLSVDHLTATASWVGNRLRWRDPRQSAEYEILRSEGSDPDAARVIGRVGAFTAAFEDTHASAGQLYHYWVRTVAGGEAAQSGRVTTQPRPPSARALAKVSAFVSPMALDDSGRAFFSAGNQMTAITLSDGATWTQELPGDSGGLSIVEPEGQILLVGANSTLRFASNGADRQPLGRLPVHAVTGSGWMLVREGNGTAKWKEPGGPGEIPIRIAKDTVLFDAVAADGTLFGLTADWQLLRLEPDGTERWRVPLTPYPTNLAAWPRGAIGRLGEFYFVTSATGLTVVNPDGSVRWHRSEDFQEPVLGEAGTVFARLPESVDGPDALHAMDPATGTTRWTFPGASLPVGAADGTVFCVVWTTVYALDEATGAVRWAFDASSQLFPQPGVRDLRLDDRGTLVGILFDQMFEMATGTRPARSGWPMARHDARNTAAQGSRGDVPLEIERVAGAHGSVLRLHVPLESADGLWLISSNLHRWRFAEPEELRAVPGDPGTLEIPMATPATGAPVSAYFRWARQ